MSVCRSSWLAFCGTPRAYATGCCFSDQLIPTATPEDPPAPPHLFQLWNGQEIEATFEPIQFDSAAVRSYGLIAAAAIREGRKPRSRFADLLIAATAHANNLDLYTRNGDDFAGLDGLVHVVAI